MKNQHLIACECACSIQDLLKQEQSSGELHCAIELRILNALNMIIGEKNGLRLEQAHQIGNGIALELAERIIEPDAEAEKLLRMWDCIWLRQSGASAEESGPPETPK